ncbi:hypothetical protein [Pseudogemmobacter sonorensis]|uniref:hypothetical protein n=1 Tax=Pseudogemmobacter sonorensis TaxID=2989681 RepID=UPI0036AD4D06
MSTDTERLLVSLEARVNQFERNFQKANRTANTNFGAIERRAKTSATRLETSMASASAGIARNMKGMATAFAGGLVGGVVTTAMASLTSNIAGTVKGIAEIGNEARRAGVGVQAFQEWSFVAQQNRISVDALVDGFKELNLRADEFITTGAGSAAEAFGRLGFRADDLKRKLADPSALMLEILGRMQRFNTAAQIRIADEIFGGTGGEQFVELLAQGDDALRATIARAHETGAVLDAELIAKAEELDRKFAELATTMGNFGKRVAVAVAEAGAELVDMRAKLDELFPDEAQGRAILGDDLYNELDRNRDTLDQNAEAVARLRGQYTTLGDEARTASNALLGAMSQVSAWGYEEQADTIARVGTEMRQVADDFNAGTVTAEDFTIRMTELEAEASAAFATLDDSDRINFAGVMSQLSRLGGVIAGVTSLAQSLKAALQQAAGISPDQVAAQALRDRHAAEAASMANYEAMREANERFTASETARNAATSEQLRLQREVEAARKRASDAGVTLTAAQAEAAARAALAGEDARRDADRPTRGGSGGRGAGGRENAFDRDAANIRDRITAMEAEIAARRTVTGSIEEQEAAVDRARIVHELLNSAQEAGFAITPQLRTEVEGLADSYIGVEQAAKQLADAQADANRRMEDFKNAGRDAFASVLTGAQTFGQALSNLSARLAEMAANRLFDTLLGGLFGKIGGGFLGGIFGFSKGGPVHAATGGRISGPGTGTSDSIPAMLSDGEYVVNAKATRKHLALLEAINSGRVRGLAAGGMVGSTRLSSTYAPSLNISVQGSGNPVQDQRLADLVAKEVQRHVAPPKSSIRRAKGSVMSGMAREMQRATNRNG